MRAHRDLEALDESGRLAVRTLTYGLAALTGAAITAALLLGLDLTTDPLPECGVTVPATTIRPTEQRT